MILKANGAELGITEPFEMFWATGLLSSFLDNTPTYLVFLTTAGALGLSQGMVTALGNRSGQDAGSDLLRCRIYGREYIYRQRAELYGQIHCG